MARRLNFRSVIKGTPIRTNWEPVENSLHFLSDAAIIPCKGTFIYFSVTANGIVRRFLRFAQILIKCSYFDTLFPKVIILKI